MRWNRFFADLEDQLASEWEAERAGIDDEAERLRTSRLTLRDRLAALVGGDASFDLADGTVVSASVRTVGAEWAALNPRDALDRALIVPFASIRSIGMLQADLVRSARPSSEPADLLSARLTLGFVLRDVMRRRVGVAICSGSGRLLTGTIDRAGSDHLDLALHEPGAPRRAAEVTGHRIVPYSSIAWVRLEGGVNL